MKTIKINKDNNFYLSDKLNKLFEKIKSNQFVECIYVSYFESTIFMNNNYIGIDIVFDDKDYYDSNSENLISFVETYTSVISKKLYEKGFKIHFNVHSSKRSSYYKERSVCLETLSCSEILYDKYGIYTELKENTKQIDYENLIEFEPPLVLNKL